MTTGAPAPVASGPSSRRAHHSGLIATLARDPDARRLAQICAIAVALRVAAALALGDRIEVLPGIHDQVSYDALARRVAAGAGFSFERDWWPLTRAGAPTAHWSFLYTGLLAGVYRLFGPHPLAARLLQALLTGVLLPLGTFRLAALIHGRAAGRWAALLAACYPYFVYYGAALMTEALTVAAAVWLLAEVTERARTPASPARWVLLGVLLATVGLLRQVALAPAALALVWIPLGGLGRGRGGNVSARGLGSASARGLAIAVVVAAVLVAPATWRNYRAFGRLVPISTNAGFAFFWANHPIHGTDFQSILPDSGPGYVELIPPELRPLDEAAMGDALMARGLGFVRDHPGRYLRLCLSRVDDYFLFWPRRGSALASNVARALSFGLALPFIVIGLVRSRSRWRVAMPCYLFVSAYTLIHLLSWALVRYRLPVDAVLLAFAGSALADLGGWWAAGRAPSR